MLTTSVGLQVMFAIACFTKPRGIKCLNVYVINHQYQIKRFYSGSKQKETLGDILWERLNEDHRDSSASLEELETGITDEDDSRMWHHKAEPTQFLTYLTLINSYSFQTESFRYVKFKFMQSIWLI